MAEFNSVPVVEIHNENFKEIWPSIMLAIKTAAFAAMDIEMSGLGERKQLGARSIDDRYKALCDVTKTRSILSVGLSCFKLMPESSEYPYTKSTSTVLLFQVQTFNIFLLCSENYVVEPVSLRFLVEHGFDFNKQYAYGLPYYRGNDKATDDPNEPSMRQLFSELVKSKLPVVLHNGFVDLVYIYQNLYANLPSSQARFLFDLSEIFSGGLYDTKVIAEYKARMTSSYLEYVFRKSQRDNSVSAENGWSHVRINCARYMAGDYVVDLPCGLQDLGAESETKVEICDQYANHGWCPQGQKCLKSHDVDKILDQEKCVRKKQKTTNLEPVKTDSTTTGSVTNCDDIGVCAMDCDGVSVKSCPSETTSEVTGKSSKRSVSRTAGHRAGYDSFMTGFIFAFYLARSSENKPKNSSQVLLGMVNFMNKIYLTGKDIPLQIARSVFSKPSKEHKMKYDKLFPSSTS